MFMMPEEHDAERKKYEKMLWNLSTETYSSILSMFKMVTSSAKRSFYVILILSVVVFGIGTVLLVLAAIISLTTGQQTAWSLVFGGLSAANVYAFVWAKPFGELRENMARITITTAVYTGFMERFKAIREPQISTDGRSVTFRSNEKINADLKELVEETVNMLRG